MSLARRLRRVQLPRVNDFVVFGAVGVSKFRTRRWRYSESRAFYDEHFASRWIEVSARDIRMTARRRQVLSALVDLSRNALVVDIGCGVADILKEAPPTLRRLGLDLSPNSLAIARTNCPDAVFACASAYELPLAEQSVDALVCLEVIEHLEHDRVAMKEFARVLRPGGILVASVPNHYYFRSYLRWMGHFRHYNAASFTGLAKEAGFETVRQLNQYLTMNRLHLYVYGALRSVSLLASRWQERSVSPYDIRLPGARRSIYAQLDSLFHLLMKKDEANPRFSDSRQTFTVFQRSAK
jgi:SAM-dependent methyltransferase